MAGHVTMLKPPLALVDAHGVVLLGDPGPDTTASGARRRRYLLPVRVLAGVVLFLLVGNLAVLAAHRLAVRQAVAASAAPVALPIDNFTQVDDRVWRGAAPSVAGYEALARNGVVTVIDLRAEEYIQVDEPRLAELGINRVHIPLRDGQAPGVDQVERFLAAVRESPGRVYVHCGAGVGRTGTMAAAWLVSTGEATPGQALRRNLAVGPPSLEQLAFAARLDAGEIRRPPAAVVALSRVLDAPRRTWVHLRRSYK